MSEARRGPLFIKEIPVAIIADAVGQRLLDAGYNAVSVERSVGGFTIHATAPATIDAIPVNVSVGGE